MSMLIMKTNLLKLSFLCLLPLFLNACDDKPVVRSDYQKSAELDSILDKYKDEMENYSLTERTIKKLKNLDEKCSKNDLDACEKLYYFYSREEKNIGDPQKASDYTYQLCMAGKGRYCKFLADNFHEGKVYEKNEKEADKYYKLASQYYQKDCSNGDLEACAFAVVDNRNKEEYTKKLESLCDADNPFACQRLVMGNSVWFKKNAPGAELKESDYVELYMKKRDAGYKKLCEATPDKYSFCTPSDNEQFENADKEEKEKLLSDLAVKCDNGDAKKCASLSFLYTKESVFKNMDKRNEYLKKACDLKDKKSCTYLADEYQEDKEKQENYYSLACDLDDVDACEKLVSIYSKDPNSYEKAFDLASYVSENTSYLYLNGLFPDGSPSLKENFAKKYCLWNQNNKICGELAEIYNHKGEYQKANPLLNYICNNGKVYDSERKTACELLSQNYDMGNGLDKDHEKALSYAMKACELSGSWGCEFIAQNYLDGYNHIKSPENAHKLYQFACENNDKNLCSYVAMDYLKGIGVEKDINKAKNISEQYCDFNNIHTFSSCLVLGQILESSYFNNPKEATSVYKSIYDTKDKYRLGWMIIDGSTSYAHNLKYGYGVDPSVEQAEKIYFEICKMEPYGCSSLAEKLFTTKDEIPNLYTKQLEIGKTMCALDDSVFCEAVGELYDNGDKIPRDTKKAMAYYKKGCELKNYSALACVNYGYMLSISNVNVPNRIETIISANKKACDVNPIHCNNLGAAYANYKNDNITANKYYRMACDAGKGFACKNLGWNLLEGKGVKQDIKQGIEKFEKACELKEKEGCLSLGQVYMSGKGVRKDISKAKEYFGTACDLGSQDGCKEFARLP